jgi:hypothetical protein
MPAPTTPNVDQGFMNLRCLVQKGLITDAEYQEISGIARNLAGESSELLKVLVALNVKQTATQSEDTTSTPISSEAVNVTHATAVELTPPASARYAVITPLGNAILFRMDGNDPTDGAGHYGPMNENLKIGQLDAIRMIAYDTSAAASVFVTYYP